MKATIFTKTTYTFTREQAAVIMRGLDQCSCGESGKKFADNIREALTRPRWKFMKMDVKETKTLEFEEAACALTYLLTDLLES